MIIVENFDMSRIGKKPIKIPPSVIVKQEGETIIVKGPKGENKLKLHPSVVAEIKEGELIFSVKDSVDKQDRALWGLFRALISSQIEGVTNGFEKQLEMHGIGYKANIKDDNLILEVGFSHPVTLVIPSDINVTLDKSVIMISGIDKESVGAFAARVREIKKPEPYQGKGIRHVGEIVRRKAGKAAKAAGAGAGGASK